jgi:hypothetical protein
MKTREPPPANERKTNTMSGNLTPAPARDDGSRISFNLRRDQAKAVLEIAATCPPGFHGRCDPVYRDLINAKWLELGLELGFRWTTVGDLTFRDRDGWEVVRPADADRIVKVAGATFTAEPEGQDQSGAILDRATALLIEAAQLFRFYEAHHRAKATPEGATGFHDVAATIAKAKRNAEIAGRIEAFLHRPAEPLCADGKEPWVKPEIVHIGTLVPAVSSAPVTHHERRPISPGLDCEEPPKCANCGDPIPAGLPAGTTDCGKCPL